MSKPAHVCVELRHCGGNVERMIRRFIKRVKKERIVEEAIERRRFIKPSEAKRIKRRRAMRQRLREERKRMRRAEKNKR